jgi:hypothetical protein
MRDRKPVEHGNLADSPAAANLVLNLLELLLSHRGVGFVVQEDRDVLAGQVADGPEEEDNGPTMRRSRAAANSFTVTITVILRLRALCDPA